MLAVRPICPYSDAEGAPSVGRGESRLCREGAQIPSAAYLPWLKSRLVLLSPQTVCIARSVIQSHDVLSGLEGRIPIEMQQRYAETLAKDGGCSR